MAVRVVFDGPPVPISRKIGRSVALTVGTVLLVLGVLAVAGAVLVGVWLIPGIDGWNRSERPGAVRVSALCAIVAVACLPIAVRLLRGRRQLVLFLRRFGFDDATRTVTYASAAAISRAWRLVTLDDDKVAPLGGPPRQRRRLGTTTVIALVAIVAVVGWFAFGGPDSTFGAVLSRATGSGSAAWEREISKVVAAAGTLVLLLIAAGALIALAAITSMFSALAYGRARSSDRAKTDTVRTLRDVTRTSRRIAERSRRIFAPLFVVVRVADQFWQESVLELADRSAAVIVDVSVPSENLVWEIETLLPRLGERCVLVGRSNLIVATQPGGRTIVAPSIGHVIDGMEVLAYGTTERDQRRFAKALEGRLENLLRQ